MASIVISGVSRGLGRALAREFSLGGHRVAGGCRRPDEARELGLSSLGELDVTAPESVDRWAQEVLRALGPPDLVLNNAGYFHPQAPLWEVDPAQFSRVLEVNVTGSFLVARAFLPAMLAEGKGVIVNYTSGRAQAPAAGVAAYCASKAALEVLTRALALELPPDLAAVALSPGPVATDMLRLSFGDRAGEFPEPEAWARVAAPLLLGLGPKDNGRVVCVPSLTD